MDRVTALKNELKAIVKPRLPRVVSPEEFIVHAATSANSSIDTGDLSNPSTKLYLVKLFVNVVPSALSLLAVYRSMVKLVVVSRQLSYMMPSGPLALVYGKPSTKWAEVGSIAVGPYVPISPSHVVYTRNVKGYVHELMVVNGSIRFYVYRSEAGLAENILTTLQTILSV